MTVYWEELNSYLFDTSVSLVYNYRMNLEVPKIWELYPALARSVKDMHQQAGLIASGHDADHDFEVGQLALMVAWPENQQDAVLAGVGGLLHSADRILEVTLGLEKATVSEVPTELVRSSVISLIASCTDVSDQKSVDRIVNAVVHHGSRPNQPDDDLVMIAIADGDRLANMGATLPIRSGQHNHGVRLLNPLTIDVDPSDRSPREKYNRPDSVLWDIQNCINWARNSDGPYALRLERSLEIGRIRAERLERYIQDIMNDRIFIGLYPYPAGLL